MKRTCCSSRHVAALTLAAAAACLPALSQEAIYDEARIPAYTLPDALTMADGRKVASAGEWRAERRPELVRLFETHIYGRAPQPTTPVTAEVFEQSEDALGGKARRRQVAVYLTGRRDGPRVDVLIYLPRQARGPVPAFLGLNFAGNQAVNADPAIRLSESWMRESRGENVLNNRATEASRGSSSSRWPVEMILARGYALATAYYGDIDPDFDDGFRNGIHPWFYTGKQTGPAPDEWGSIAAWAWGLSRILDVIETSNDGLGIDAKRVAVIGHSRLGKTALWAGAVDERFALVISNDSGCGGAALNRRRFGESVRRINTSFPHWFCDNYLQYNDNEDALPVDQHELIALMAPRPVYVASAEEDRWADPKGEFLSAKLAGPVYALFGYEGLPAEEMPAVNHPVAGRIGYHIRTGKHDVTDYDWTQYLGFADRQMK